jgi:hypothetical protein
MCTMPTRFELPQRPQSRRRLRSRIPGNAGWRLNDRRARMAGRNKEKMQPGRSAVGRIQPLNLGRTSTLPTRELMLQAIAAMRLGGSSAGSDGRLLTNLKM